MAITTNPPAPLHRNPVRDRPAVTLELPARPESIPAARSYVAGYARGVGMADARIDDVMIAVAEACVPACWPEHADRFSVAVGVRRGELLVTVTERGPSRKRPSGQALWLMHTLGQVVVEDGDPGTRTILTFPLAPAAAA